MGPTVSTLLKLHTVRDTQETRAFLWTFHSMEFTSMLAWTKGNLFEFGRANIFIACIRLSHDIVISPEAGQKKKKINKNGLTFIQSEGFRIRFLHKEFITTHLGIFCSPITQPISSYFLLQLYKQVFLPSPPTPGTCLIALLRNSSSPTPLINNCISARASEGKTSVFQGLWYECTVPS